MHRRLLFLCPDLPHPSGGVRVLYRHSETLRTIGHDTVIVHGQAGFRDRWFGQETTAARVLYSPLDIRAGQDVVVIPEIAGEVIHQLPGVTKVVFCQTPFYAFRPFGKDHADPLPPYDHPDVKAILCVSEEGKAYLEYAFPQAPVYRIRNGIDPSVYHPPVPPEQKRKLLTFMPRKLPEDVRQVIGLLRLRGGTRGMGGEGH